MLVIRSEVIAALSHDVRFRFGESIIAALREEAPEVVLGLSEAELRERLGRALDHAERLQVRVERDLRAFLRLCFVVGPDFCRYSPWREYLAQCGGHLGGLFDLAEPAEWDRAEVQDVLDRSRSGRSDGPPLAQLVPLTEAHAEAYCRHALHPDVWRLGGFAPPLTAAAVLEQWQQDRAEGTRTGCALLDGAGAFVGALALDRRARGVEVSYWVRRDRWGAGLATQALRQLLREPPAHAPGDWVVARVEPWNLPSRRVLEKAGFVEGQRAADGSQWFGCRWMERSEVASGTPQ